MAPKRPAKIGRPSKGPRRTFQFGVSSDLNRALVAQAAAEGVYKDRLMAEIVAAHFPGWTTRPAPTEPVVRSLAHRSDEKAVVRLPEPLGDAVHAQGRTDGLSAAWIIAEILATHLPERIERFRPSDAPQQEELTLTSS